ncbi:MAG: hypothetical protein ABIG89_03110 [Candidatus Woesearchaeota archaeon]
MRKKSQISMEYLIVFGIAFLVIISGTFTFMKFAKSGVFTKQQCLITEPGISCENFVKHYLSTECTTTNNKDRCVVIYIKNTLDEKIKINKVELDKYSETVTKKVTTTGHSNAPVEIAKDTTEGILIFKSPWNIETDLGFLAPGDKITSDFIIEYTIGTDTTTKHYLTGFLSGRLLPMS